MGDGTPQQQQQPVVIVPQADAGWLSGAAIAGYCTLAAALVGTATVLLCRRRRSARQQWRRRLERRELGRHE